MRLSRLNEFSSSEISREHINSFGGYDAREVIKDNYFADMQNMSDDLSPVLSTRKGRKFLKSIDSEDVTIFEAGEKYYIAQNTQTYQYERLTDYCLFNSEGKILVEGLIPGKKKIAKMGAYVAIFPDKVVYNTQDGKITKMEAKYADPVRALYDRVNWKTTADGEQPFEIVLETGQPNHFVLNVYAGTIPANGIFTPSEMKIACLDKAPEISGVEPRTPQKGDVWLDTSTSKLKLAGLPHIVGNETVYSWVEVTGITTPYAFYHTEKKQVYFMFPTDNKIVPPQAVTANSPVKFEMCNADGSNFESEKFTASATQPTNPTTGLYWLDTSKEPSVLKVYDGTMWCSLTNTYVKITPKYSFNCVGLSPTNAYGEVYSSLRYDDNGQQIADTDKIYVYAGGYWIEARGYTAATTRDMMLEAMSDFNSGDVVNIPKFLPTYGLENGSYMIEKIDNSTTAGISRYGSSATEKQTNAQYIVVLGLMSRQAYTVGATGYGTNDTFQFSREVPDMDFIVDGTSRIWGCNSEKHEIYACQDSNILNWNFFQGTAADSIVISDASYGEYTGAILFGSTPLFFKEDRIIRVTGAYTGAYSLTVSNVEGVQKSSGKSLAIVKGVLYYKAKNGINAYDGSVMSVSSAFGEKRYTDAVATEINGKYYISVLDEKGKAIMFVFNPSTGYIFKEDDLRVKQFCGDTAVVGSDIYSVVSTLSDDETQDGTQPIEWYIQTGRIGLLSADNKYVSKICIKAELAEGTRANVYIKYNSADEWEHKGILNAQAARSISLPIIPKRCEHFQIKIEGKGAFKLYSLTKTIEKGSEINA